MSRPISSALVESGKVWLLIIVVVAIGFVVTYQFVEPPPPSTVRIATGGKDGAYHAFAQKYAALLARDDITLEIVSTAGSVENLRLLRNGEVSLALVQGGSAAGKDRAELQSLGSMFLEPVWIFTRKQRPIKRLGDLTGKRVAVGPVDSGTRLLSNALLAADGVEESDAAFIAAGAAQAVPSLVEGKIDAAFFVASSTAAFIGELLRDPRAELFSFARASAYAHLFPFLTAVTLNEGVIDLPRNIPPRDITLVAVAANLVARQDLNSNLVPALMKAVTEVHQQGGIFEKKRQFPSVDFVDLPMNRDARRYIENGPSFLYRWTPYTAAVYLDRLKIMLLPFIALMIPLFRLAPPLYRWRVRWKIYRWYAAVRDIESTIPDQASPRDAEPAVRRLNELEKEVASVSVPLSYAGELYHLRLHIRLIADKLAKLSQETTAGT
jgi:TRAP transporter TAXI family solute receptor